MISLAEIWPEMDCKLTGFVKIWHVDFGYGEDGEESIDEGKRYKVHIDLNRMHWNQTQLIDEKGTKTAINGWKST